MKNKGFTLIEMMITIAIVAIILAMVTNFFKDGKPSKRMYKYERAQQHAEMYLKTNNFYTKRIGCNSDGLCSVVTKQGEKFMLSCPTRKSKSKESCIELFNYTQE